MDKEQDSQERNQGLAPRGDDTSADRKERRSEVYHHRETEQAGESRFCSGTASNSGCLKHKM